MKTRHGTTGRASSVAPLTEHNAFHANLHASVISWLHAEIGRHRKGERMKVQDFAYNMAARAIDLLEETQHYRIPEELRKQVLSKIQGEIDDLLKKSK